MEFGAKYHENETIEVLQENIWPAIESVESENRISKITKPRSWLETIEDRVLILNFVKPAFGERQQDDAVTLSFFGSLNNNK